MDHKPISVEVEQLATVCVNAAFKVHRELGPGLLESVYEACMVYELKKAGVAVEYQKQVPILYDGHKLDAQLRLDILVENRLIVEIKAVERMPPVYTAQLMTYLKLTKNRLGLLINFNVPMIRDGIKRVVID